MKLATKFTQCLLINIVKNKNDRAILKKTQWSPNDYNFYGKINFYPTVTQNFVKSSNCGQY